MFTGEGEQLLPISELPKDFLDKYVVNENVPNGHRVDPKYFRFVGEVVGDFYDGNKNKIYYGYVFTTKSSLRNVYLYKIFGSSNETIEVHEVIGPFIDKEHSAVRGVYAARVEDHIKTYKSLLNRDTELNF